MRRVAAFALGVCVASAALAEEEPSAVGSGLAQGSPAVPLERAPPEYPKPLLRKGLEGWVVLSFLVNPDGSVSDVIVEDSTSTLFEEPARAAVRSWTYTPAKLGGEPVAQAHTSVVIAFQVQDARPSKRFVKRYREIQAHFSEGDLAAAERTILALGQSDQLNIRERAYLAMADAELRGQRGEDDRQLTSLLRATVLQGKFLGPETYASALRSLYVLHLQRQEIARALGVFLTLRGLEETPADPLVRAAERARDLAAGDKPLGRMGRIATQSEIQASGAPRVWSHQLMRRELSFRDVAKGSLESLDFRCRYHRATDEITTEKTWRIPASWGGCTVYVYGTPGTTFTLVEYPDPAGP